MKHFRVWAGLCAAVAMFPVAAPCAQPLPLRTIYSFATMAAGSSPSAAMIAVNGNLYGTTAGGGTDDCGTVFKLNPMSGAHTIIHSFTCSGGTNPQATLLYLGGALYGTTMQGGAAGVGTVFSIGLSGFRFTLLHTFMNADDGEYPSSGLLYHDGMLYGAAAGGGSGGGGTLYGIALGSGAFTVLHSSESYSGAYVPDGQMVFLNGLMYGTLMNGGPNINYNGAIFNFDPASGAVAIVHYFDAHLNSPNTPTQGLIAQGGVLYGTTIGGGRKGGGAVFSLAIPSRAYKVLHVFDGGVGGLDGWDPVGSLSLVGGKLYGVTYFGGAEALGTIYAVDATTGAETVLHRFTRQTGTNPYGGLAYFSGLLYGTTVDGMPGSGADGTIFSIAPG